jgi:alpha-L-fucosidase
VNGEGIYGTRPRPGTDWAEGDNVRFTCSKDNRLLYCFVTEWPGKTLQIASLESRPIQSVEMLGYSGKLRFRVDAKNNFVISIPDELQSPSNRPGQLAWAFKLSYAT